MSKIKIAVYGCGNMANGLIRGIYNQNKEIEFHTYTPSHVRAKSLADAVNGVAHQEIADIPECDFYLIACKPQQISDLGKRLKGLIANDKTIISILAGTTVQTLIKNLEQDRIIRVMPNIPCLISEGISLVYLTDNIEKSENSFIINQLEFVSKVIVVQKESKIDEYIGISASGPAYIFELARILSTKASQLGLPEEEAISMVNQMIYGSAKLLKDSNESAELLRNKVTSKKGVTFEALKILKESRLEAAFNAAIDKTIERSKELN
jgi:pyrroline-5-carboxylate reductase